LPVQTPKTTTINLEGTISTTEYGLEKLMRFYNRCKAHNNTIITLEFYKLTWIDANMVAVLTGLLNKLKIENNLSFNAEILDDNKFDILFSNGFFNADNVLKNDKGTCVHLKHFNRGEEDDYVNYIENDLLEHKGLSLNNTSKEIIIDALIEIYSNYCIHSMTEYPIYVCGQYYPQKKVLKFTIFDLGIGFFPSINDKIPEIVTDNEAISWALIKGNSTKKNMVPGGIGLSDLKDDLIHNNGHLEIISGKAYKKCILKNGKEIDKHITLDCNNIGTTINLFINCF